MIVLGGKCEDRVFVGEEALWVAAGDVGMRVEVSTASRSGPSAFSTSSPAVPTGRLAASYGRRFELDAKVRCHGSVPSLEFTSTVHFTRNQNSP